MNKKYANNKGQALLFVVVAMTIALVAGINASVRSITSLSRTSRTDTSSRALAAAEGGIERFLSLSTPELEQFISGTCPVGVLDDGACLITFDNSSDTITSQAHVTLERFDPEWYSFELESGQIKEVNLYDYNASTFYSQSDIEICFNSLHNIVTDSTGSEVMYVSYASDGVKARGGLKGPNTPRGNYKSSGFTDANGSTHDGFEACKTVDIGNSVYGLRIRSVGGPTEFGIFPTGGVTNLPLQGYRIHSIGRIAQDETITATRTISVVRSLPYLPVSFDYALYSEGGISK